MANENELIESTAAFCTLIVAGSVSAALLVAFWLLRPALKRIWTRSGMLALAVTALVAWPVTCAMSVWAVGSLLFAFTWDTQRIRLHPALPLDPAFYIPWLTLAGTSTVLCGAILAWAIANYSAAAKALSVSAVVALYTDAVVAFLFWWWLTSLN